MIPKISTLAAACLIGVAALPSAYAGNPDRQGEAGAYELLLNPWAKSAGLNGLVTARTSGVEALYFNPAGLGRLQGTELMFCNTQYMVGTGMSLNAAGFGQSLGENSRIGVSLMSMSFGEIPLTTTNQPEGIGTFKPTFFNLGISYGHVFRDPKTKKEKITVGVTVRLINEAIANATTSGAAFDAGVQYSTGKHNQIKFGIALRNIGTKMRYKGEGLSFVGVNPTSSNPATIQQRTAGFDLPSLLSLGLSYDFLIDKDSSGTAKQRLTVMGQFIANSYSRDQMGLGIEYAFKEMVMARVAYKYESGMYSSANAGTVNAGLTAGLGINLPLKKGSKNKIGFDYAYELTRVFNGTHSLGLRMTL